MRVASFTSVMVSILISAVIESVDEPRRFFGPTSPPASRADMGISKNAGSAAPC